MRSIELARNFALAQALDVEVTLVATQFLNTPEINPLAAQMFDQVGPEGVVAAKIALTALFVGGYYLSRKGSERFRFVMEKSILAGNYLYATLGILNTAELATVFLKNNIF